MVLLGYETGTKEYRLLDPLTGRLHVSSDVSFEQDQEWCWNSSNSEPEEIETFTVEVQITVHHPATSNSEGENCSSRLPSCSPSTPVTPPAQKQPEILWATPPSDAEANSEEGGVGCQVRSEHWLICLTAQMRFKTLSTVVCVYWEQVSHLLLKMLLDVKCWREAILQAELQAIKENKT
jgi:hypothetical protein